jgi:hypothetical protein
MVALQAAGRRPPSRVRASLGAKMWPKDDDFIDAMRRGDLVRSVEPSLR